MNVHLLTLFILILCSYYEVCFSQEASTEIKVWKNTEGSLYVGKLINIENNDVNLELINKELISISQNKLTPECQRSINNITLINRFNNGKFAKNLILIKKLSPIDNFIMKGSQKKLTKSQAIEFYQQFCDEINNTRPEFKMPKDIANEDKSLNRKYLQKYELKDIPISERKNLFTQEIIKTKVFFNEPEWKTVTQKLDHYQVGPDIIYITQVDTLKAENKEKQIMFRFSFKATPNRSYPDTFPDPMYYEEQTENYLWRVRYYMEKINEQEYAFQPKKNISKWIFFSIRKDNNLHIMSLYLNDYGKIVPENKQSNLLSFHLQTNIPKYPLNPYYQPNREYYQNAYDENGNLMTITEWNENMKTTKKPDKPELWENQLNLFESNHRDQP